MCWCTVCLFVGCLTSQQQASVSQGRICTDNFMCCHSETKVADQTFYLTQSKYTDTGPSSPSADPITPGAWQGSHWSANFWVTGMTRSEKIPSQAGFEPLIFHSRGIGALKEELHIKLAISPTDIIQTSDKTLAILTPKCRASDRVATVSPKSVVWHRRVLNPKPPAFKMDTFHARPPRWSCSKKKCVRIKVLASKSHHSTCCITFCEEYISVSNNNNDHSTTKEHNPTVPPVWTQHIHKHYGLEKQVNVRHASWFTLYYALTFSQFESGMDRILNFAKVGTFGKYCQQNIIVCQ